jgi:hypothetical protein
MRQRFCRQGDIPIESEQVAEQLIAEKLSNSIQVFLLNVSITHDRDSPVLR